MKKFLAAALISLCALLPARAQDVISMPYSAAAVADFGNGPIKVRVIQGNASIFTAQGSGVGSTAGSSTSLTLTGTPATAPKVGALISGTGITSGTTVSAYNGTTGITLSAAMTVSSGTTVSWGASCPASAAGIPAHFIQASVMADYYVMYTQARVCAVSPGGPLNTLLTIPIYYESTSPGGGGGSTVTPSPMTRVNDTNVQLTLGGTPNTSLLQPVSLTLSWAGTLAAARLNANVVQAVTNDTNITGSIAAQNLTFAWAGTLAAARLNANVVQAVTNDTNITGSIAAQNLTFAWAGTLANARLANMAANTVKSNWTGGAAAPADNVWPACANDGSHALVYINGTGLQCATITAGSGSVTSVTLTAVSTSLSLTGTCSSTTLVNCVFDLASNRKTGVTVQDLTSGTGATYTPTSVNITRLEIWFCGGGGGGAGAVNGTGITAGSAGNTTTFNGVNASGGGGAPATSNQGIPGPGGTGGSGTATLRMPGNNGYSGLVSNGTLATGSGSGAGGYFGGGGVGVGGASSVNGTNAAANTCAGGAGAFNRDGASFNMGGGGGAGETAYLVINPPIAASYTYTIGTGGTGGASTNNGGNGGSGRAFVREYYNFLLKRDVGGPANDNTPMFLNVAA